MNQQIKDIITENRKKDRPLSEKSLNAYASTLSSLYKKVFGDEFDGDNFNKFIDIIGFLNDMPSNKRKTILASLLTVATDKSAYNKYHKLMMDDAKEYDKEMEQNTMTDKYEEKWVTGEELKDVGEKLKEVWDTLKDKENKTTAEIQDMQQYIIYLLSNGQNGVLPRRLLDWTEMKVERHDARQRIKPDYNIYDPAKKQFYFYRHKTDKSFNRQIIKLPKELYEIMNDWLRVKPESEYLFVDSKNNKLSPVTLNQRFEKMLGKHKSINSIRHSFITEKYSNFEEMPSVKEIKDNATKMAHSGFTHLKYIKRKVKK